MSDNIRVKPSPMKASDAHAPLGSHIRQQIDPSRPVRLFISYSHKDKAQQEEVVTCLKALPPDIDIEAWDDTRMRAGDRFNEEIFREIDRADLFLALISRYYLASDYCRKEMTSALQHAEKRGCRVVPVIVGKTESWRDYPIGQNLALPPEGKAPSDWKHEEEHWAAIESGLKHLLRESVEKDEPPDDQPNSSLPDSGAEHAKTDIPEAHGQSSTGQPEPKPFETHGNQAFQDQLRLDLRRRIAHEALAPAVEFLAPEKSADPVSAAVNELLTCNALDAIEKWTDVAVQLLEDAAQDQERIWSLLERVHCLLLPRLVDQAWLQQWRSDNQQEANKRFLTLTVTHRPPNRAVEVLLGRLDRKRGVHFEQKAAVPPAQIDMGSKPWRFAQAPDPRTALDLLGRYLMASYDLDPIPDSLGEADWISLDAQLLRRPRGRKHGYYLVIPEGQCNYSAPSVIALLHKKLPNLPRLLLFDTVQGPSPFECRKDDVEAVIQAFWDLRPKRLS